MVLQLKLLPLKVLKVSGALKTIKLIVPMLGLILVPETVGAVPNGTWLSQPQIWYYSSSNQLDLVMSKIRTQQYKVVFLDYRKVSDELQQQVSQEARRQGLFPVVWIQSPQFRSLSVPDLVYEARHGDGIQLDDHFFSNYKLEDFYTLRRQYAKPIFCSIQPFQAGNTPRGGCNQLDLQCYAPQGFQSCVKLADRLGAVVSLSAANTMAYHGSLGGRLFNTFLWP